MSFVDAIKVRYAAGVEEAAQEDLLVSSGPGQRDKAKKWELVGMEKIQSKQSSLAKLTIVSVRGEKITCRGEAGAITATCPRIRELDMRDTSIPDWNVVGEVAAELPALHSLDLSENDAQGIKLPATLTFPPTAFQGLKVLVLNQSKVVWSEVTCLLPSMPQLQELHLEANNLVTLESVTSEPFRSLRVLNLTGNNFTIWSALLPGVSSFPLLENLVLTSNPIGDINQGASEVSAVVPELKALSLQDVSFTTQHASSPLTPWEIRHVCSFPKLSTLKITYEPFFGGPGAPINNTTCRLTVLGQIPTLTILNGSAVRPKERQDSEKYYLTRALQENNSDPLSEPIPDKYRHYQRYLDLHGLPVIAKTVGTVGQSRRTNVTVTFRCLAKAGMGKADVSKPIPLATKVSQLKSIVKTTYGVDVARQKLFCREEVKDKEEISQVTPLTEEMEDLLFYGVQDGNIIEIHE